MPHNPELPAGSYVKEGMCFTPMKNEGKLFFCKINLPEIQEMKYHFWITRGPGELQTDIREGDKGSDSDFHLLAGRKTVFRESTLSIHPNETLSLVNYSKPIILTVTFLFFCFLLAKYLHHKGIVFSPLVNRSIVIASSLSLFFLFMIRPAMLGISWEFYFHPLSFTPKLLWTGFYDLVYVASLTSIFLLLILPFRQRPEIQFGVAYLFVAVSLLSMISGVIQVKFFESIGSSGIYNFVNSGDYLKRVEAGIAVPENISTNYVKGVIVVCLASMVAGALLTSILDLLVVGKKARNILLVSSTFLCVSYIVVAQEALSKQNWKADPSVDVAAFFSSKSPFSN